MKLSTTMECHICEISQKKICNKSVLWQMFVECTLVCPDICEKPNIFVEKPIEFVESKPQAGKYVRYKVNNNAELGV